MLVGVDLTALVQPANFASQSQNTELTGGFVGIFPRSQLLFVVQVFVIRVDDAAQRINITVKSVLCQPHEFQCSFRPDQPVRGDVNFPTSDARCTLCVDQPTLGLCQFQHAFGLLKLHFLELRDVGKHHQRTHHHGLAIKPDLIQHGPKTTADETALGMSCVAQPNVLTATAFIA